MTTPPEEKSPRIRSANFIKTANEQADLKVVEMEKKLEQDLQETQKSLIQELQDHGFLLKDSAAKQQALSELMQPITDHLVESFDKTRAKIDRIGENKNYFAMSLKDFFIKLSTKHPDLLELMCHNYVHQWVNKDTKFKNK